MILLGNFRSKGNRSAARKQSKWAHTRAEVSTSQAKLATTRTTIDETTVVHDTVLPTPCLPLLPTSALCGHKVVPSSDVTGMRTCANNSWGEKQRHDSPKSVPKPLFTTSNLIVPSASPHPIGLIHLRSLPQ